MLIASAIEKMIDFYQGDLHDIDHFLRIWSMPEKAVTRRRKS